MKGRTTQNSFNGGEISARMAGRTDLDGIYDRATAQMLNYVPTVEGPAIKRSGFRYVNAADPSSAWLSRFVYNQTQAYLVEWLDYKLRFYTNGGRIETSPGVPYELAVPYTAAQAARICQHQSFDRLYLAHPDFPPAMLTRTAAETFEYAEIPLKNGPFEDLNTDKTKALTWSGTGSVDGIATITLDTGDAAGPFTADHVGAPFLFETKDFSSIKAWEPEIATVANISDAGAIAVGSMCRSNGKAYKATQLLEFTGTIQPTHSEGAEWDGMGDKIRQGDGDRRGVKWEYQFDRFGAGVITTVVSDKVIKIRVTRALPTVATSTYKWALGSFSSVAGWPQVVTSWGQRLIFWRGIDLAGSVVGDYWNMAPIDTGGVYAPDMGFRRRMSVADPPMWCHADKQNLLAGSHSQEITVGQINRAEGLSANNLTADAQSSYGSAQVWPVAIGTAVLWAQRGGRKIREAEFSYQQERFTGANINIYARHITRSGVRWLAFQQEPEEMLWAGRADGTLIAHPHSPEQGIKGFSRVELAAGSVLSGVAIPSEDGDRDELWILADLDGQRAVLQLADWWEEEPDLDEVDQLAKLKTSLFLDWSVSYDGAPQAVFTQGLSHLNGRTVRVLADGAEINELVVTAGTLTLPKAASVVHVGLGYQARIKLLPAEVRGIPSLQGLRKRAIRMFLRLIDSAAPWLIDRKGDRELAFDRPNAMAMDRPRGLFTGDTDNKPLGGASDLESSTVILSDDALPSIVSLVGVTYEAEELKQ